MDDLSPLDGRYKSKVKVLRPYFSEWALMRARVIVEIQYFQALAAEPKITGLPKLSKRQAASLEKIIASFDQKEAKKIKTIEATTNHDVKAVEYYLKQRVKKIPGLKGSIEYIHFGLTSEDVNNLAYGILVHEALSDVLKPRVRALISLLKSFGRRWQKVELLSLTHGQPATPTTLGKEFLVFADRLQRQCDQLKDFRMHGKFGGAVANYSAHRIAYPKLNWEAFGRKFVQSLKLVPLTHTTQINPHDDIAELSQLFVRINTIVHDLCQDCWLYIMRGVFKQKVIKGEVGSSAMPHKVNPIDFENAEGNTGLSSALFNFFAQKLPISRLQRDLSDSTVQRNLGVAFGYNLLALISVERGLKKLELNKKVIQKELRAHPEVRAEAIQTILRKNNVEGAYELLKEATRGERITAEALVSMVQSLDIPEDEKKRLIMVLEL